MRMTTLIANSLTLSLGCFVILSILAYLVKLDSVMSPVALISGGIVLILALAAIFAVYLRKKFGPSPMNMDTADTVLVNETWLLKH